MTAQPHESLALADFPAWEQRQQAKHEFADGHVYLYGLYGFAGGTQAHNRVATMLVSAISSAAARPCRTYGSDMLIEMATSIRYADVAVTCDPRDDNPHSATIRFPRLIVEVLSESTARDDLGQKMREYQAIETLEEYVTIDSRKPWAQLTRRAGNAWVLEPVLTGGPLELHAVTMTIDLDNLYATAGLTGAERDRR